MSFESFIAIARDLSGYAVITKNDPDDLKTLFSAMPEIEHPNDRFSHWFRCDHAAFPDYVFPNCLLQLAVARRGAQEIILIDDDAREGKCEFVESKTIHRDVFWIYELKGLQLNDEVIRIAFKNVRPESDGEGGIDIEHDGCVYAEGSFDESVDDTIRDWYDAAIYDDLRESVREFD